ncbi:nitric oxide synthase [Acinetobacter tandoii]|nr:nitric oxide synthase [Acinetobacter tandoii]
MIKVLFGTESGNSEMAADDISAFLEESGINSEAIPMDEYDVAELAGEGTVIVITSTYGEGELPETTVPFFNALNELKPDLSNLKFLAFGLGDSTYDTYGNGIDIVTSRLVELGAKQIGDTGRHDAAKVDPLADVATGWVKSLLSQTAQV